MGFTKIGKTESNSLPDEKPRVLSVPCAGINIPKKKSRNYLQDFNSIIIKSYFIS